MIRSPSQLTLLSVVVMACARDILLSHVPSQEVQTRYREAMYLQVDSYRAILAAMVLARLRLRAWYLGSGALHSRRMLGEYRYLWHG